MAFIRVRAKSSNFDVVKKALDEQEFSPSPDMYHFPVPHSASPTLLLKHAKSLPIAQGLLSSSFRVELIFLLDSFPPAPFSRLSLNVAS